MLNCFIECDPIYQTTSLFKAFVCYFHQTVISSPKDNPSKTIKNYEKCFLFRLKSSFRS